MMESMALAPRKLALLTALTGTAAAGGEARAHEAAREESYQFAAVYTADVWRNTHGGLRAGGVYLDNLDLTLSVDGERAWGLKGLSAFAYVMYNNSARLSERYVGDAMTVSNIDAPQGLRLYEAWIDWTVGGAGPLGLRFGLYDLNSELDSSESRSLFIHSTHGVGHDLGQTGENGPSIFPVTSLGLRAAWELTDAWRVLAVVLDGVPGDRDNPDRSGIYLSSDEGALGAVELQWSGGRIRKLSVGYWSYTARFDDVRSTEEDPLPRRRGNDGAYAAVEVALDREASGSDWLGFVRAGVADGRINEFDDFIGVGVRRRGLTAVRPEDELGLAFSRARTSAETRAMGLMTGAPRDSYEAAIELTYRAPINDWLTIQPDVQYIFNPGADASLRDSLLFGLRFEFSGAAFR